MLAHPASTQSQQYVLQDRLRIASSYPVCELWALLQEEIVASFDHLTPASLLRASDVAKQILKVMQWIEGQGVSSVLGFSYLGALQAGAHETEVRARLASLGATGTGHVTLDASAVSALSRLAQWDDVLGLYIPAHPDQLGAQLVLGTAVST